MERTEYHNRPEGGVDELRQMLEDKVQKRKLARRFISKGDFTRIEEENNLEEGTFDALFAEDSEIEVDFSEAVANEAERSRSLKASHQIGKTIDRLFDIAEDIEQDSKTVTQASNIILSYYAKIRGITAKEKEDDDDDISSLYKQVSREKNGK